MKNLISKTLLIPALLTALTSTAEAAFNCSAFVLDKDQTGNEHGYVADFRGEVNASPEDEWKIVTLTQYGNVKMRIALSRGKIHTMSISDGNDEITQDSGTLRARRQDFWHDLTIQDLELSTGKVTYYMNCMNLSADKKEEAK